MFVGGGSTGERPELGGRRGEGKLAYMWKSCGWVGSGWSPGHSLGAGKAGHSWGQRPGRRASGDTLMVWDIGGTRGHAGAQGVFPQRSVCAWWL